MGALLLKTKRCEDEQYEAQRLDTLYRLQLLNTSPNEAFDRITRMAAKLFNLPISAVSLTDSDRQWFKSRVGVAHASIPREKAPCGEVSDTSAVLVIPDMTDDPEYQNSYLAQNGIRFYAGAPLVTGDGYNLGAMCVLGMEAREASAEEVALLKDLASMVMSQIELQHAIGRIDPLSGLANRKQFQEDLEDLHKDTKYKTGDKRLLVLINLAKPEELRDGLRVMGSGHFESLVRRSATLLQHMLGNNRTIYHVGEMQFAFFALPGVELQAYSKEVVANLSSYRSTAITPFLTTVSIGIASFHPGCADHEDILRRAHSASYDAFEKEDGVSIYSPEQDAAHLRRFTVLSQFSQALANDSSLSLVYQPRIDVESGTCISVEALLRWTDLELGAVSPGEFMPLVELSSMSRPITAWVLETAICQLKLWQQNGVFIQASVNISASNLLEPDFCERLVAMLALHQVEPSSLELELTESAFMSYPGKAKAMLGAIAQAGVRLAIDDFGTGYSSLSYLQSLPVDVVKIDQSFIRGSLHDNRTKMLIEAMVGLSHDLGFRVVAEGVETEQAFAFLRSIGCDEAQGYLFAKPMPPTEFTCWLGQHQNTRCVTEALEPSKP